MRRKISLSLIAAIFVLLMQPVLTIAPVKAQNAPSPGRFGVGCPSLLYTGCADPFIDYFFQSTPWSYGTGATVGPDGYPTTVGGNLEVEPLAYINGAYQFYGEGLYDIDWNGPGNKTLGSLNPYAGSLTKINGQ